MAQELDIANTKAGAGGLTATGPALLLRIPPPPRPDRRPLLLMPPGLPPRAPVEQPQSKPGSPPSSEATPDPTARALLTRRLEKELADLEAEVEALQQMLQELPTILEGKFQARLRQLRDQQQLLEGDNLALRQRLEAIAPGSQQELPALPPRGLLPPALRLALKRDAEADSEVDSGPEPDSAAISDAGPTRAVSADPRHR
jgi:hypothetical protein